VGRGGSGGAGWREVEEVEEVEVDGGVSQSVTRNIYRKEKREKRRGGNGGEEARGSLNEARRVGAFRAQNSATDTIMNT